MGKEPAMADSNDNTNWRDGLTAEQQAMVEKVLRASHEEYTGKPWSGPNAYTEGGLRAMLAGLRAVGVIPPAKVKTRGEVVAEKLLYLDVAGTTFFIRGSSGTGYGLFQVKPQGCTHEERLVQGRESIAGAIDAERDAAIEEAAEIVKAYEGNPCYLNEIRALKSNPREHLRDDVAQPHEPAAPTL
jgi:hypothetical protein